MIFVWFRNYEHDLSENKIQCFHGLGFALRMCLLQIIFLPRKMELAQVKTSTGMAMLDGLKLRNILRFLRIRGRMVCFIADILLAWYNFYQNHRRFCRRTYKNWRYHNNVLLWS
ncbi:uncharacterized protein LOC131612924 [Vicia villosa]|uniref:uncharacterized protein LOC131612924 n=1 Tax=Vicia villosa TaxID=3911 RepID=UPI00273CDDF2|nr:uncharacterized protein LOC131612924 [Vicia villosa]